ncbi:MAG: TonB-dependent receptor, partial [Acidobacteria bacterium]|nr:TonB-dependent receptor [Acidobacteriota bacterium]
GSLISMAGSRPVQQGYLLDWTIIKTGGGTPSNSAGVMVGVESIQEFQVLTSGYSAEFGGSSGGLMSMVTKSGTNELHGSLYYTLRNDALDARGFFAPEKDPFKRNQWGGTIGGPIKKDKAFFFGNYEGLAQRELASGRALVPDENMHLGLLPAGRLADGTCGLKQVKVADSIRPYLDLWPRENGGNVLSANGCPSGIAVLNSTGSRPIDSNYYLGRVDYNLTNDQTLTTRVNLDRGNRISPSAWGEAYSSSKNTSGKTYVMVQHQYIITPLLLSTMRVSFNRSPSTSELVMGIDYPENLKFVLGLPPGFTFPGVTRWEPNTAGSKGANEVRQISGNLAYVRGGHSMKFGTNIQSLVDYSGSISDASRGGNLQWATAEQFLTDARMNTLEIKAIGGHTHRQFTQKIYGFYFQDDWNVSRTLTLNLGLRYEPYSVPKEKHNRVSVVKDWVTATSFDVGVPFWKNPSKKDLSPRVGFAWDPTGSGNTAVRGGFGIFPVLLQPQHYGTPSNKNPPFIATIVTVQGNLASLRADLERVSPTVLTAKMNPNSFMEITEWDLSGSYEMKYNFTVERQLGQNLGVSVAYIGGRGNHLWRNLDVNTAASIQVDGPGGMRPFVPAGAPRVNPNTGVGTSRMSDAQSFYNALQFEVKKRLSRGFQVGGFYTWSKNVDDTTTSIGNLNFQDFQTSQPYNPKADRARSSLHVGQNIVINGVYQIPSLAQEGFLSHLFGGWQISSIFTATDGVPFSPLISGRNAPDRSRSTGRTRPDLVAGRHNEDITQGTSAGCTFVGGVPGPYDPNNPNSIAPGTKLGTPELYFDHCAFYLPPPGFYGNAGRNIMIGPGYLNFDASLLKRIPVGLGEGTRLEFRAEFFNLFNRTNFSIPETRTVLNPTTRVNIPAAGKINSEATPPRQLQFGLKLTF